MSNNERKVSPKVQASIVRDELIGCLGVGGISGMFQYDGF